MRTFLYNGKEMPDPDPTLSPSDVCQLYAMENPELLNAAVTYDEKDGVAVHTFEVKTRKKG